MESYTLASGYEMPVLGFGTWQLTGKTATEAVRTALELGYTHIDTADAYSNHQAIERALRDYNPKEIFITSKIPPSELHHDNVLEVGNRALKELGIDTLDLLLIHWPNHRIPIAETLAAMAELVEQGKVLSIGVSNFMIDDLEEALEVTEVPISVNQVKYHPYHNQQELLDYCKAHDIVVTAYSPFGNGAIIGDPKLERIAGKYGKSHTQVILRWLVSKGMIVIPKSSNPDHIEANMDIFDWDLKEEDIQAINQLSQS